MFALRFDPNKAELSTGQPVVPLKRTAESESESDEENGQQEQLESESKTQEQELELEQLQLQLQEQEQGQEQLESESKTQEQELELEQLQLQLQEQEQGQEQGQEQDQELKQSQDESVTPEGHSKKHGSVISRFQQALKLQDQQPQIDLITKDKNEPVSEVHPLEQIPQPALVRNVHSGEAFEERKSIAWRNTRKIHYDNTMIKPFISYQDQLQPRLLENVRQYFSKDTFPIQTVLLDSVLPVLNFTLTVSKKNLTRRVGDILVNASTGSGKTLAYCIPIVQALSTRTVNRLRALILVPTKLLINQVYDTMTKLAQGSGLIISISKPESSLKEEHQKFKHFEPDVLIVTPGRLVDHLQLGSISMKNLMMLVLDEADHLLNQSFQNWSSELMNSVKTQKLDQMPGNIIKMVFSATLTTNTEKLYGLHLYNPRLFVRESVKLYSLPDKLQEYNVNIPTAKSLFKPLLLLHIIDRLQNSKVLVFVKSNEASLRLATLLNIIVENNPGSHHSISSVNSNNTKADNKRLVHQFATSTALNGNQILITTDLMSRGIDINDITDVVNYDLPISSQQYIHRCGRTARAQGNGNAHNILVGKGERTFWTQIDNDLSRNSGYAVIDSTEQDPSIIQLSSEEEEMYKSCLKSLRELASRS